MAVRETPKPLQYSLSAFRWHLDTRPPSRILAIHDYMGSAAVWEQIFNKSVAELPLKRMTPVVPLEVYCVNLRGHGASDRVGLEEGQCLAQASAADVALLHRDVLNTETELTGIGFGAMVACLAALHSPDSFTSLRLFVKDFSQLFECNPADYAVRSVVRSAPADATSLGDMNSYLEKKMSNPVERAMLLSAVQEGDGAARFRFSDGLLKEDKIVIPESASDSRYDKGVRIMILEGGAQPTADQLARFKKMFPQVQVGTFNTEGEVLGSPKLPMGPLLLQYFGLLGMVAEPQE